MTTCIPLANRVASSAPNTLPAVLNAHRPDEPYLAAGGRVQQQWHGILRYLAPQHCKQQDASSAKPEMTDKPGRC